MSQLDHGQPVDPPAPPHGPAAVYPQRPPLGFPLPYAGISHIVACEGPEELLGALAYLASCHGHHVAVELDANRLWGTRTMAECFLDWRLNTRNPKNSLEASSGEGT